MVRVRVKRGKDELRVVYRTARESHPRLRI